MRNTLENKIRWYFKNIDSLIDPDALELLKVGCFDADGVLTFPSVIEKRMKNLKQQKERYLEYWRGLMENNER